MTTCHKHGTWKSEDSTHDSERLVQISLNFRKQTESKHCENVETFGGIRIKWERVSGRLYKNRPRKKEKSKKIIVYVVSYLHILGKQLFGGMNIV
jgi:hypothetical protein